jgi:hypothetical protein
MNEARARELYKKIRERAPLASPRFAESYNANLERLEIAAIDDATGEATPIAVPLDDCSYDDRWIISHAPESIAALLLLLDLAFAEIRKLKPAPEKNYAAQAAMQLKNDKAFRRYLIACHGLPDDADEGRAKTRIYTLLRIGSLSELSKQQDAADRWKSLQHDFKSWMRETR